MMLRAARGIALALTACLFIVRPAAQDRPLPDQDTFLRNVRAHLQTDNERQQDYMYVETQRRTHLDGSGQPHGEDVRVIESYPGLPGENRWSRVIEEDGKRVPETE